MRRRAHRRRSGAALVFVCALLGALTLAPAAGARVLLVATGTPELALVELSTNAVAAQIAMPAAVSAITTRPFGGKGYAAAGNTIIEIDIDARAETRRTAIPGTAISQLASARDGRLVALQGDHVTVIDPATLTPTASIALDGVGKQLTLGRRPGDAAVVLADGRVAILALAEQRLLRTVRVRGATGVAVDGGGRTWVTAGRFLRLIPKGAKKLSKRCSIPPSLRSTTPTTSTSTCTAATTSTCAPGRARASTDRYASPPS